MIVFTIKTRFFNNVDSYNFGQKSHKSCIISLFYKKMIRVIYAMFAITINDLKLRLNNKNLPLGKSTIWFEPYI